MSWFWPDSVNEGFIADLNSCPLNGDEPFSFFCWFKAKVASTNDDCLWQASDSISGSNVIRIGLQEGGGDLNMYFQGSNTPMVDQIVVDQWATCTVVQRSTGNRSIWKDGKNETNYNSTAHTLTGMDRTSIGYEYDVSPSDGWRGLIGYSCVWKDYVLTPNDIWRLSAGHHPLSLQHIIGKLVQYEPLNHRILNQHRIHPDAPIFLEGNNSLTTPVYHTDEPPVFWPQDVEHMSNPEIIFRGFEDHAI